MQMQPSAARLTPDEVRAKLWPLEEQMGLLIEHTPAAIAVLDRQMRYLLVSRRWLQDYRLGDRDIIGCSHYDIFPEIPNYWRAIHQRCLAGAVERCDEEAFLREDGTIDWLKWEVRPWHDDAGEVGGLMMFTEVITQHKQAESAMQRVCEELEAKVAAHTADLQRAVVQLQHVEKRVETLQRSETVYRTLVENSSDCICQIGLDGKLLYMNQNGARCNELNGASEVCKQDCKGTIKLEYQEQIVAALESARRGEATKLEYVSVNADGQELWWESIVDAIKDGQGKVISLLRMSRNITDRKHAEARLKQLNESLEQQVRERTDELQQVIQRLEQEISDRKYIEAQLLEQEQFLRTVIDATPDWIFAKDHQFRYILVNQSYAANLGKTVEEMLGKDDLELGFSEELVFGNPEKGIRGFRADDQAVLAGDVAYNPADPATFADGSLHVFDTRKVPLSDQAGTIFAVLGISHDLTDRHQTEEALRRSQLQLKEKAEQLEQAMQRLQRTQARLIQNEKMSSLGQLVAGVTHEINNPVSFIYGNLPYAEDYIQSLLRLLTLYQQHYPNPAPEIQTEANAIDFSFLMEDLPKLLQSMKAGTDRIQKIVASLRTFSRIDETTMQTMDVHEILDSALVILQNRLKATDQRPEIIVLKDYGNLPIVECCTGQLNQVFMNILSNAIDALEEGMGDGDRETDYEQTIYPTPRIWIRTELMNLRHVKISITDNGPGIPIDVQQRLFDPFFTTKPVGKGTGMGLSICYQIVTEKHRGSIHCVSAPRKGADFIVQLPVRQT